MDSLSLSKNIQIALIPVGPVHGRIRVNLLQICPESPNGPSLPAHRRHHTNPIPASPQFEISRSININIHFSFTKKTTYINVQLTASIFAVLLFELAIKHFKILTSKRCHLNKDFYEFYSCGGERCLCFTWNQKVINELFLGGLSWHLLDMLQ